MIIGLKVKEVKAEKLMCYWFNTKGDNVNVNESKFYDNFIITQVMGNCIWIRRLKK